MNLAAREVIAQSVEARETSRTQRLHRALQALLDATRANPPANEVARDRLLGQILDALIAATEAHMGNLQLCDPRTHTLRIRVERGFSPAFLHHFDSVHEGLASCGAALQRGEPVVVDDVSVSPLYPPASKRAMAAEGIAAVQSLPLQHEGRKLGVVSVHYRRPQIAPHSRDAFASTATVLAQIVAASDPAESKPPSRTPYDPGHAGRGTERPA